MTSFKFNLFIFGLSIYWLRAQNTASVNVNFSLSEIALLDIEPPLNNVSLSFVQPTEAGAKMISNVITNKKWLNYTSAKSSTSPNRIINAQINQLIPGLNIKLQASTASGSGGGALGVPTGIITLTTSATTVITGIGGAFTGNGENNGHLLNYSLEINDYKKLVKMTNNTIIITYTITN